MKKTGGHQEEWLAHEAILPGLQTQMEQHHMQDVFEPGANPADCPYLSGLGAAGIELYQQMQEARQTEQEQPTLRELLAASKARDVSEKSIDSKKIPENSTVSEKITTPIDQTNIKIPVPEVERESALPVSLLETYQIREKTEDIKSVAQFIHKPVAVPTEQRKVVITEETVPSTSAETAAPPPQMKAEDLITLPNELSITESLEVPDVVDVANTSLRTDITPEKNDMLPTDVVFGELPDIAVENDAQSSSFMPTVLDFNQSESAQPEPMLANDYVTAHFEQRAAVTEQPVITKIATQLLSLPLQPEEFSQNEYTLPETEVPHLSEDEQVSLHALLDRIIDWNIDQQLEDLMNDSQGVSPVDMQSELLLVVEELGVLLEIDLSEETAMQTITLLVRKRYVQRNVPELKLVQIGSKKRAISHRAQYSGGSGKSWYEKLWQPLGRRMMQGSLA